MEVTDPANLEILALVAGYGWQQWQQQWWQQKQQQQRLRRWTWFVEQEIDNAHDVLDKQCEEDPHVQRQPPNR
jgi:hypothetical protein